MILRWRNIVSMYQCVTYSMRDMVKWRRRSEDNTLTGVLIHFASELETLRFSPDPYGSYAVSHFGSFGSYGKLWCIIENYSQSIIISRPFWSTPVWGKQPWVRASMSLLEKCLLRRREKLESCLPRLAVSDSKCERWLCRWVKRSTRLDAIEYSEMWIIKIEQQPTFLID